MTESHERLLGQISRQSLMEFTEEISKEVRLSGSEEEFRAFRYAEQQLKSFGFETNLYHRKALISLPMESKLQINGVSYTSITHSMAPSTPEIGVSGEIVYMENGFPLVRDPDLADKVLLIDGLATPGALLQAQTHMSKAVIFINAEYTHEMIVSTVWGNPAFDQLGQYPKIPAVSITFADGEILKAKLSLEEKLLAEIMTQVDTAWRDIPTLIADYKASEDVNPYVLFSGHIDSWHHGAMDNGSANATMLEVARIIGTNKTKLHRSLRLAFWSGHSHGRYAGSALYADEHWEDLYDNCVLHLNIDSVGGKNSSVLSEANAMAETKDIVAEPILKYADQEFNSTRYGKAGDQSFWGMGVPSLLMGLSEQVKSDNPASQAFSKLFGDGKAGGFGWWWHTTEDTIDKLDPVLLERDCRIYLATVLEICTNPLLPIKQQNAIKEITGFIRNYQRSLPEPEWLGIALNRLEKLDTTVKRLTDLVHAADFPSAHSIRTYNHWNKQLSRILVRLNYVGGNRFSHDTATPKMPIPLLAEISQLEQHEPSPAYYSLLTTIRRNINEVNFNLREALELSEQTLKNWEEIQNG
ncbi:M28 family peptidase [Planococcus sp. MERTA32b]|nr:M28 family peptidase [Planococcus sp. MER TA 32b]